MILKIQVLALDRHKNATGLNRLLGSQPMYSTHALNKVILFKIKIIIFLKYNYISRMGTGQKKTGQKPPGQKAH
jgi:hypothetical protein